MEDINNVLSWIFFAEMIIKIMGLGVKEYAKDKYNLFDAFVVIISTVEMIVEQVNHLQGNSSESASAISALRGVRILRIFKLAKQWKSF